MVGVVALRFVALGTVAVVVAANVGLAAESTRARLARNAGHRARVVSAGAAVGALLFGRASGSPGLHELLLAAGGYRVVMTQLHRVGALTPGEAF